MPLNKIEPHMLTFEPALKTDIATFNERLIESMKKFVSIKDSGGVVDGITNDVEVAKTLFNQGNSFSSFGGTVFLGGELSASTPVTTKRKIIDTVFKGNEIGSITLNGKQNLTFENVSFENIIYLRLLSCKKVTFKRCNFNNLPISGIVMDSLCNKIIIEDDCVFDNIGYGTIVATYQGMAVVLGGTNAEVRNSRISNTFGYGAIHVPTNVTNFLIDNNDIEDTFYRGVDLYGNGSSGLISNNRFKRMGYINTTNSGVGCNAVFGGNGNFNLVDVQDNHMVDMYENGVEGSFGNVDRNYIKNTATDIVGHPTPSTEGIYANGKSYKENTVVNPYGSSIKMFSSGAISDLEIINNHLYGKASTTFAPIDINSQTSYTNVKIDSNDFHNYTEGVALTNKPKTNVEVRDNKNYSRGKTIQTSNGAFVVTLDNLKSKNSRFINWVGTPPDDWTTRNSLVSKVVDGERNYALVTPNNIYTGGLWQDISNDYELMNITVKVILKGTITARISITPFNDAGVIDDPLVAYSDVTPSDVDFNTYYFSLTNVDRNKYRIQVGANSIDNTKNITVKSIEVYTENNRK